MTLEAEQRLFDACLAASGTAERERLLDTFPDPAVAARVRHLLAIHDADPGSLLPPVAPPAPPRHVGPFRILERLGEGAIGEVFLAEQLEPVRRRVGLKILKFGVGTREVIARFQLERYTLALMTHPNVARILDAGATPDGRPYFAMEYVPGVPVTRYCDERRLDLDARVALFCEICAGVQHAHLRGVIHRDLKPSNILVTEIDGEPVPKIIDFGIAKATTAVPDGSEAHTRIGHVLGTPEYMSPEQAQLSPLDVDARTDVYSLGVLLYELLTGARPYAVTRDSFDPAVIAREITGSEITRPSLRAAEPGDEPAARAAARGTTPRALAGRLRGDLDWIVLKALEKDRQRRYSSAAELASDLGRARDDRPVTAGPPSTLYLAGKFVRRHRFAVATLAGAFVAALAFGSGMAVLAGRAAAERDRANAEAEVARRVTEFTAGLFETANPERLGASDVSARQLLDAGVRRLATEASNERADVRAALFEAAGNAYRGLGEYAKAAPLVERAVALRAETAATAPGPYASALRSQAVLAEAMGDYERAERLLGSAIETLRTTDRPDPAALRAARLELANVLRLRDRLDAAAGLATAVVAEYGALEPADVAGLAGATATLGRIELEQGRVDAAIVRLERAVELHRRAHGDAVASTLQSKSSLAFAYVTKGESGRAEPLLREIVDDARRIYGPEHVAVGVALSDLGNAVSDFDDRLDEAEQIYLDAVELLRRGAGPRHPELATGLNNLCSLYLRAHEWTAARDACAESGAIRKSVLGPGHAETAAAQLGEALALNKLGDFRRAESLLRATLATFTANLGADHWRTANAQTYLGMVLANQRRYTEAEDALTAAEATLATSLGPEHWRTLAARTALAEVRQGRATTAGAADVAATPNLAVARVR